VTGETVVPQDRVAQEAGDPCVRYKGEEKVRMGSHCWIWKDLLKVRQCTTCGEERLFDPAKRFQQ
jgi:hypothetical protein